jgi:hypothetical protein
MKKQNNIDGLLIKYVQKLLSNNGAPLTEDIEEIIFNSLNIYEDITVIDAYEYVNRKEQQKAEEEYRRKQAIEREKAERAKAEETRIAEEARKQELYSQCKQTFDSCNDILFLTNAIVKLETIIDWQNSRQLINKIQNKIGRLQIEEEQAKYRSQKVCQHCGGKFKGLFNKRCSVCGMPKDY